MFNQMFCAFFAVRNVQSKHLCTLRRRKRSVQELFSRQRQY